MALASLFDLSQSTDSLGNIFDANGAHIGVVTGSQADVGSSGVPSAATVTPAAAAPTARESALGLGAGATPSVATSPGGLSNSVTQWIGSHVEDAVFVVIGLILIAAAVFSFKGVQDAAVSTAKTAAEVAA
jgi:hypothetical protein